MDSTDRTSPTAEAEGDRLRVETFGCRLNAWESEVVRGHLKDSGRRDVVVVNTCAVTAEAERQARQSIRRLRRDTPDAEIVVTGCAAQIDPAKWASLPEVDRVVGNEEKMRAETWAPSADHPAIDAGDIMAVTETAGHLVDGLDGRVRAFVQVQQGCDHRCTFCIIPFGRGNSRSVPIGEVVRQVRHLVSLGHREVVLTGVDITSYGGDLPGQPSLGQMMRRLLAQVPELPRLRLSSIDMVEVDADLLALLADEPRLMPHLHLSLQSGDDMILKRMKRRHLTDDAATLVDEIRRRRPDVVLGADLIAGFPTETEAMFENTLASVDRLGLTHLHVFPYSERPGTPAARMPAVPVAVRKERAARLRALGERRLAAWLAGRVGRRERVLMETPHMGRTEGFASVTFAAEQTPGHIIDTVIMAADGQKLAGAPNKQAAA